MTLLKDIFASQKTNKFSCLAQCMLQFSTQS